MNVKYCDALVIGGGLAGLRAAVAAGEKGLSTIVLSLIPVKRSHSAAAQGGMQASLGNSKMSEGDNEDVHFADTVKGSDWGCDQDVARMFCQTAPKAIRELAAWGVPWTRIKKGERSAIINAQKTTIVEKEEVHGLIHSRDFGGTKKWRTCYTADATGHTMLFAVANEALKHNVAIEDRKEAIALIHENNRCYGAIVRDLITGDITAYVSKGTLIATGGYGRVYKHTTNAVVCEGIGAAIALETGVARLGNMEAVQFHPTPIVPSGILLTEGCRGDGGILRDVDGYRFMPDYEPEKKELASRDVVSRRIMEHIRKGKGVKSAYGDHVWLDISILGREHIEKNLRDVQEICQIFNGIDPADEGPKGWAPILPMQHYSMGGIKTNAKGESPTLQGLFSAGEAACWDMHGFNRLGGNSVSETVVAGMIVGDYFADYCNTHEIEIKTQNINKFVQDQIDYMQNLIKKDGHFNVFEIKNKMKDIMWEHVAIFRTGEGLEKAVKELEELYKHSLDVKVSNKNLFGNPELEEAYRVPKMLKLALCIAYGALLRTESRGAHYREDYTKRDDLNWLSRTLTSWKEGDTMPTVEYEKLDIMKMEMPPAFRGYGAKGNIIEHPDSAIRQAQVDEIRSKMQAEGKSRQEIQEALMHYELQPKYKAPNERAGIGYE
ncbi:fumarate reductase flavoprotein subunit [Campylobacter pinnipediorum]|uniref:Fumarate reductase flavoprotein subunit n=1 Tax=Campylobacter pinnipediorum subsp. pinnipediorum TaxID=1660067 RepID=A0AAX0LC32_9BACT|nr:fumarate reductase flavoprotein subunit [Campylobacter pinnipediorum]AQW81677.1 fumarate reductase, flavoprotein subunit [Campylobacter pinnipediorum subsp. pinnipediorum]AQW83353.1 fumarate reductase, flavoprotein subunit [Campylobacter pinnipediorum subsp. pinnipediorum]AQW84874.1 fumarate reductase, flavoprotein subunit [Campylobacter pinnipediorum subsp. pinnipediorum]OPA79732.1 fumarate reductase flavoprotein subunit [Campylobacter pinnipediorum subsp. pinnipediorum]OPA81664.1 fumarate